jgi:hypothetical protein
MIYLLIKLFLKDIVLIDIEILYRCKTRAIMNQEGGQKIVETAKKIVETPKTLVEIFNFLTEFLYVIVDIIACHSRH